MDVTELSDRAVRSFNRDAVREAIESSRSAATTEVETELKTMPGTKERGADDRSANIDRQFVGDRRVMLSADYLWQSASSQDYTDSTRQFRAASLQRNKHRRRYVAGTLSTIRRVPSTDRSRHHSNIPALLEEFGD